MRRPRVEVIDVSDLDEDVSYSSEAVRLREGLWVARCDELDLWATGSSADGAAQRLAILIDRSICN